VLWPIDKLFVAYAAITGLLLASVVWRDPSVWLAVLGHVAGIGLIFVLSRYSSGIVLFVRHWFLLVYVPLCYKEVPYLVTKLGLRVADPILAHWDRLILKLDVQINDHVEAHPAVRDRVQTLCLVCGVGPQTALTLVAEFPELGRLPARAAAKLAGLAPLSHDSGQWQGRRHIAHGRAPVRRALFQAALVAARHNEHLRPFYLRLRANGKPPKLALIAVARKLLIFLNRTLKEPASPQL